MDNFKKKILVVDDDHDIREIISLILIEEGYLVTGLNNGRSVVKNIQNDRPDLVLLDVQLGDVDGRDVCKELKGASDTCAIPVMMISANSSWQSLLETDCKADDFLDKPFDIVELVDHVKRYAA